MIRLLSSPEWVMFPIICGKCSIINYTKVMSSVDKSCTDFYVCRAFLAHNGFEGKLLSQSVEPPKERRLQLKVTIMDSTITTPPSFAKSHDKQRNPDT